MKDADAAGQQLIVLRVSRMEYQAAVGHAGQHHGDVHATFRGGHQRIDRLLVGHEIGGRDVDGFLGFLDG